MKHIRRSIYQGMVSFIEKTTAYNLADIARVTHEPYDTLKDIMQNCVFPVNRNAEVNLIKLYAITVDLHHLYNAYGKSNNAHI